MYFKVTVPTQNIKIVATNQAQANEIVRRLTVAEFLDSSLATPPQISEISREEFEDQTS